MATRQVSVRMPTNMIDDIRRHGDRTSYIVEAVRDKLERDRQAEYIAGLMTLVGDPENDISDFGAGQARVIEKGD